MKTQYLTKLHFNLTLLLAALVAIASCGGVFIRKTYSLEVPYYAAQGMGQDLVNLLLVVPVFAIAAFLSLRGALSAWFVWAGSLLYIMYSYWLYCFALHFNYLFLVYCASMGLSVYLFIFAAAQADYQKLKACFNEKAPRNLLAGYLYFIASLFALLWLSEIIPALVSNTTPKSITDNGMIVNAVHVLDLSLFLPAMAIAAWQLQKKIPFGYFFAPAMLAFSVFMALAIVGMMVMMKAKGMVGSLGFLGVFGVLILASTVLFVVFVRAVERKA